MDSEEEECPKNSKHDYKNDQQIKEDTYRKSKEFLK
jgi:hypothetical protein